MKKRLLKQWVVYLILMMQAIVILVWTSECDDLGIFMITKTMAFIVGIINHNILVRHSDFYERGF